MAPEIASSKKMLFKLTHDELRHVFKSRSITLILEEKTRYYVTNKISFLENKVHINYYINYVPIQLTGFIGTQIDIVTRKNEVHER